MAYGFEVRGPGGQLWLGSSDLTTRVVGIFQLSGLSGRVNHSDISPGNTVYQIICTVYWNMDYSLGGRTYPDCSQILDGNGYSYSQAQMRCSIGNGYIDWSIANGDFFGGATPDGQVYLLVINYDG